MKTDSLGHLAVTVVNGTTLTGLFAADGSLNVFDASSSSGYVGLMHPCGAVNCTLVTGVGLVGYQAPNGSLYVVTDSSQPGIRHSSGAMNVTGYGQASVFLSTYGPYGIVTDFTDQSIAIADNTGSLNYVGKGRVSNGSLVGPGAKLTYSAPSPKLVLQADGTYKYQAHNLCLQSNTPSAGSWAVTNASFAADATTFNGVTYNKLVENSTASVDHQGRQSSIAVQSGQNYSVSVDLCAAGRNYVLLEITSGATDAFSYFSLIDGSFVNTSTDANLITAPSAQSLGNGFWRVTLTFKAQASTATLFCFMSTSQGAGGLTYSGNGTSGVYLGRVHVRLTNSLTDYIATTSAAVYDLPYYYNTSGVCQGLMVEQQATNLVLFSRAIGNVTRWSNAGASITLNYAAGIDEAIVASRIVAAGAASVYQTIAVSASTTYTWSFFAKNNGGTEAKYRIYNASGSTNIVAQTDYLSSINGSTFSRVSVSFTTPVGCTSIMCYLHSGSGAVDLIVDQAQLEAGSIASSPIVTYGSAVVRAADNDSLLTALFPYDATQGTVFLDYTPKNVSSASSTPVLGFSAASRFAYQVTTTVLDHDGTTPQTYGTIAANIGTRLALAFGSGSRSLAKDGALVVTDAAFDGDFASASNLYFGSVPGFTTFHGTIHRIGYFTNKNSNGVLPTIGA